MGQQFSKELGSGSNKTSTRSPLAPRWVARSLDTKRKDVCMLEVNSASTRLYAALLKYFATRAVDIGEAAPTNCERIHSNPLSEHRAYPGKLSSLQGSPAAMTEYWRSWTESDSESETLDDSRSELGVGAEEDANNVTYGVGFGWGCIKTNPVKCSKGDSKGEEHDVIFSHFSIGDPAAVECNGLNMYRIIVLYGASDKILKQLCRDALDWEDGQEDLVLKATPGYYVFYTLKIDNGDPHWICHGHRRARPFSSIILAPGMEDAIVNDAQSFLNKKRKKWYINHGLPYRRNYLFYGPPGCGKTSVIRCLAGEFKLKACFMSLSNAGVTDHSIIAALAQIPKPCILVFEDVDALFVDRENDTKSQLSFSGLLNAVDGIVSTEGILMVMTTNHVDRLDAALLRCGRVDRRFEFRPPGHDEIARYFLTFYPEAERKLADEFSDLVMERKEVEARSIASLQLFFIYVCEDSATVAVGKVGEFFNEFFPTDVKSKFHRDIYI